MSAARRRVHKQLRPIPISQFEWAQVVAKLRLTPQQARIVELILRGGRDKQIAQILGLAVPTVRTHLREIFRNHDLSDRVELVIHCFSAARGARKES